MLEILRRLFDENIRNFSSLPPARQAGVLGGVAVVLMVIGFMGWLLVQEPYEPLFPSPLEPEATAEIAGVLNTAGITNKLGGVNNQQLMVPSSQKSRALGVAAQEGVLTTAERAWDFLENVRMGETEDTLKLRKVRAQQRQLRNVLKEYTWIRDANVIVVPEKPALLPKDERPAQCSVQLEVRGRLDPVAIQGIVDLVRLSVPGLKEENIVITDQNGVRLNKAKGESFAVRASEHNEVVQREKEIIRQEIVDHLNSVLGPSNAIVTVALEKDFDQVTHRIRDLDTENPMVISEEKTRENSTDRQPGGEPGVGSNVPNTAIGGRGQVTSQNEREHMIANYDTSATETEIIKTPGQTSRISAAVTVNFKRLRDPDTGLPTKTYEERSEDEMQQLRRQIVAMLPPVESGDVRVSVQQMQFDRTAEDAAELALAAEERFEQILRYWVPFGGLAAILLGMLLMLWYNSRRTMRLQQQRAQAEMERTLAETRLREDGAGLAELGFGEVTDISQLSPEEQRRIKLTQKVEEFANEKPEEVANIVKTWLSE